MPQELDSQPNLIFTLRSYLISECCWAKKVKLGSSYLFITYSLYFLVHLDGYMQESWKDKMLMTKLLIIRQIIAYLSKCMNARILKRLKVIVYIIDYSANYCSFKQKKLVID